MKFPNPRFATTVSGCLFFLLLFYLVPWEPKFPGHGLDPSWLVVLTHAIVHGWHWGQDLVFTYGPASFIGTRMFHPETYLVSVGVWITLVTVFCLGFNMIYRTASPLIVAVSAVALFLGVTLAWEDTFFYSFSVMLLLAAESQATTTGRCHKTGLALLVVACALIAHFKLSAAIMAPLVCLFIDMRRTMDRDIPWFTATWVACFLLIWLLLGQPLSGLPEYIRATMHIISGYGSTMQTLGPIHEVLMFGLAAFILVASLTCQLWVNRAASWRRRMRESALVPFLLLYLLLIFKAGFIRHDNAHIIIAWSSLLAGSALFMRKIESCRVAGGLLLLIAALSITIINASFVSFGTPGHIPNLYRPARLKNKLNTALNIVFGSGLQTHHNAYNHALATLREGSLLPYLSGSVDVVPSRQSDLIAQGMHYNPRPVFQGYSAYTPYLQQRNRDCILSSQGPEKVIFDTETLDNKIPSSIDALSWLTFLSHYHPQEEVNGLLVLRRNSVPGATTLRQVEHTQIALNTEIPVLPTAGLLWVQLDLHRNVLGKMLHLLWRDPVFFLQITDADGLTRTHRLVHNTAGSGFLLSPFVATAVDFAMLYQHNYGIGEYFAPVTSLRLLAPGASSLFFHDHVDVRYHEVDLDRPPARLPMEMAARTDQYRIFRSLLGANNIEQGALIVRYPDILVVQQPADLWLTRPLGQELHLSFGIHEKTWHLDESHDPWGVTFQVTGEWEDGQTTLLWQRTLKPTTVPADRGRQQATILLPEHPIHKLVFTTTPATDHHSFSWSYWGDIQLHGYSQHANTRH